MQLITQTVSALPAAPQRTQAQAAFDAAVAALFAAWPNNITEVNSLATQMNALAQAMNAVAAGTAFAIPYTFSTTTADADPGAGYLRLDNATQNAATTIRADLTDTAGTAWAGVLDSFASSTSAVKGQIRLTKIDDGSKWLAFNVTAVASPTGYRNITVTNVGGSAASPFSNGDQVVMVFTRTGDKGDQGIPGPAGNVTLAGTATGAVNWNGIASLASAPTVNIGAASSNEITITGTTAITAFDTVAAGAVREITFAGALTLTHNATSLILPGAANITTAAGDVAEFLSLGGGNWRCTGYQKANGQSVVAPAVGSPSGLVCIATATANNVATVDFTIDGTYDEYVLEIINAIPSAGSAQPWLRMSTDGGATFAAGTSYTWSAMQNRPAAPSGSFSNTGGNGDQRIDLSGGVGLGNPVVTAMGGVCATVKIMAPASTTTNKRVLFQSMSPNDGVSDYWQAIGGGAFISTSAVNAIRILMSSGNITSGLFKLYGVRKAV